MRSTVLVFSFLFIAFPSALILDGCGKVQADPGKEAPPAAKIVPDVDVTLFSADHPEQFPLATYCKNIQTITSAVR